MEKIRRSCLRLTGVLVLVSLLVACTLAPATTATPEVATPRSTPAPTATPAPTETPTPMASPDEIETLPAPVISLAADPYDRRAAYALLLNNVLYRTADHGHTWQRLPLPAEELPTKPVNPERPNAVFVTPQHDVRIAQVVPGRIFVRAGQILYRSDDQGASWQILLGNVAAWTVDPESQCLYAWRVDYTDRAQNGLYRSEDGGEAWRQVYSGFFPPMFKDEPFAPNHEGINALAMDGSPDRLYAGTDTGIFRSLDGGRSWHEFNTGLPPTERAYRWVPILLDTYPNFIFALSVVSPDGVNEQAIVAYLRHGEIVSDQDSWESRATAVLARLADATGGLYGVHTLVQDPIRPERLYLGTEEGLWVSEDSGQSWAPFDLSEAGAVYRVAASYDEPTQLYLWTDRGLVTTLPGPTPTPGRLTVAPPPGLIYRTSDGLWRVEANGKPQQLLPNPDAQLSPDGQRALYTNEQGIWVIDLATSEERNLLAAGGYPHWCCPRWAGSDVIIFGSWPEGTDPGPSTGYLTAAAADDSWMRVLDPASTSYALPAASPDRQTIAYDRGGTAWLYHWDSGPKPFDVAAYNLPPSKSIRIASPAWSPDGRQLAWVVGGGFGEEWRIGIAVFDLEARTSRLLHPYEPMGVGGWPGAPVWSPDGQWLAYLLSHATDPAQSGLWVFRADGQDERLLGDGGNPVWSLDGRWLVFTQHIADDQTAVWLLEAGVWEPQLMDLLADAISVGWASTLIHYSNATLGFAVDYPSDWEVMGPTTQIDSLTQSWSVIKFVSNLYGYGEQVFGKYTVTPVPTPTAYASDGVRISSYQIRSELT